LFWAGRFCPPQPFVLGLAVHSLTCFSGDMHERSRILWTEQVPDCQAVLDVLAIFVKKSL
jgi:hypothetical protein